MTITDRMRDILRAAASKTEPMTLRESAAFDFIWRWLKVSHEYGRLTYTDFRVRDQRELYRLACRWSRLLRDIREQEGTVA